MVYRVEKEIAGRTLFIETGKLAKQASGAVVVGYGETVVLATVVCADPREGTDFFPLTVDYRERTSAAGKFPGGFIKREGRPTTKEILTMRMIDRPVRPLFPKGYRNEVQIQTMVWSADQQNDPDILAMIGASASLAVSDIPFDGPIAAVRVGRVDDQFVINPTHDQLAKSSLEIVLGGRCDQVNMIEVSAQELPEDVILDALKFGHKVISGICEMIADLARQCGKAKTPFEVFDTSGLVDMMEKKLGREYIQARQLPGKKQRQDRVDELFAAFVEELCPNGDESGQYTLDQINMAKEDFQEKVIRSEILQSRRSGGRGMDEIRPLSGEVALFPRTHGSALFTRGETQAMVTATLGTSSDEQIVDGLKEEFSQKFMLHYNFPPFCVGETGRIVGPGRREIGHGALAEKSLANVMPSIDKFPYTVKLVSDILESNGSSSMASVCAGTLALMDAGVPILRPVAGISIGMISSGNDDKYVLLTDILGEEDHYGDMDFKVAGTQKGITGIQLDLKRKGLSFDIIRETFERARVARISILKTLLGIIAEPRNELSQYAPRITSLKIPVDMIGMVIGPGGREVKRIQETTGAKVEIEDDGTIYLSCIGGTAHLKAKSMIEMMTMPLQVGRIYDGRVVSIKDFGAFIELAPGREGLCHVSELSSKYVESVSNFCKINDEMKVKVIDIDNQGRIKLSRKAAEAAANKE